MRISDWSSDVCSSDLLTDGGVVAQFQVRVQRRVGAVVDQRRGKHGIIASEYHRQAWPVQREAKVGMSGARHGEVSHHRVVIGHANRHLGISEIVFTEVGIQKRALDRKYAV